MGYLPQFAHRVPKIYKKILLATLVVLFIFLYSTVHTQYGGGIESFISLLLIGGFGMIHSLIVLGTTRWIRILPSRPLVKLWQIILLVVAVDIVVFYSLMSLT